MMNVDSSFIKGLFDLSGQIALVTGAGSGIGQAFSTALACAGADVVLVGRTESKLLETAESIANLGQNSLVITADISNELDVNRIFSKISSVFGRLDILVNNAACTTSAQMAHEMSLESWREVIDTDLTGTFLCARGALRLMIEQRSGKIINIASIQGLVATSFPLPPAPDYCAAKGGVIQLTRELAAEYAEYGINVNCIAPGLYLTPMAAQAFTETEEYQEWKASKHFRYKLRGPGKPDDLNGTILYLSSKASDFVSGHILVADQGYVNW